MYGDAARPRSEAQDQNRQRMQRYLVAKRALAAGTKLTADDVGIGGARASERLPERIRGRRVLLVTHAWQMRQLGDRLRAQGQEVLGAPTLITPPLTESQLRRFSR